ncbi:MAG: alpha/beta fold hydrolase [Candidatus Paceibacterota bacterium]
MPFEQFANQNQTAQKTEESLEQPKTFDEQFAKKIKIELAGAVAEAIDVSPEKVKTSIPTILAPGWATSLEVYKPAIQEYFNQGRRVVAMDHPRLSGEGGDVEIALHRAKIDENALLEYPKAELRKALNLLQLMDQIGIEKADFIAHSESTINTMIAATLRPEKFNNIVFFGPAGLIGQDSMPRLVKGFADQTKKQAGMEDEPLTDAQKENSKEMAKSLTSYFLKNPLRALNEILDISETQTDKMLKNIHDKGIGTVIMSGVDDPVFPASQMQKFVRTDMVDGFLTVKAGHGIPENYMPVIDQMLSGLEEKKKAENKKD